MTAVLRASDRAYLVLREEIVDWELPPGSVLGEVEQAARLGLSRTPLREALARLTADGLVRAQAARLAAIRHEGDLFRELGREFQAVPQLLEHDDPARHAYYGLVERFDQAVDDAVRNPYLVAALNGLRTHLVRVRRHAKDDPVRLSAAAGEHLLIVQAIVSRDADLAAHATHVHLHNALQSALESTHHAAPAEKEVP
jgi:DNA-binding GntR family transcriptional regulator